MTRETATDSRQDILHTAARLFQQQGYDATSMNDIAATLKLSKGGLYHHFQSKDEILFNLMDHAMDITQQRVIDPVRGILDPEQRLRMLTTRLADEKSVPNYHDFVYDVWFFSSTIEKSQALEWDINQFFGGKSFIWGHECRIAGGHEWDTWDNVHMHWVKSGIPCNPKNNAWNHLTIQVQRTSDNHLLFQTITLNGQTATLNYSESPTSTPWNGITINYQMDGDGTQQPYSIWLDKLNFTYW